ncbi:MerR-like DNA binding protein [Herbihabitans rhizosphaerae]|uniref:MerR-like DNA binding protein n=1 Tax=Herbihabitans rhizosphaerae TaxID=1872711 RepID=A0A4Q7KJP1_9PSEU|nr:MerR family transcriptional regulator [Herbihabitans rhizosphaerae]RZS36798.1 MerR-like DNA binding protein [Herbihabitans rhizosphaerae]
MRIAELSRRSDVPVPTIKYYLREGLLPAGERTGPNQASYDDGHLRRLRLIRALIDVGGLPVAKVRDVLDAIDTAADEPLHEMLGVVAKSIGRTTSGEGESFAEARATVDEMVQRHGWHVDQGNPHRDELAGVLVGLDQLGHSELSKHFDVYFDAAQRIAREDLDYVSKLGGLEAILEGVVIGTILGEAAFAAIRRMAHVDASARLFRERGLTQ